MASHLLIIDPEVLPTQASLKAADQAAKAEVRPCHECGLPVYVGERIAFLTSSGEKWTHPKHTFKATTK